MTLKDEDRKQMLLFYMEKAEESLVDTQNETSSFANRANMAYYSAFYCANALLIAVGAERKNSHKGVLSEFSKNFVKNGLLPEYMSDDIRHLEKIRYSADYSDKFIITKDLVEGCSQKAEKFYSVTKEELERRMPELFIQRQEMLYNTEIHSSKVSLYTDSKAKDIEEVEKRRGKMQEHENAKESNLKEEAQKNRLQAQQIQEMLSGVSRAYIFRGNDLNLQNADLNGVQENILSAADKAVLEVGDLRSSAADKEYLANSSDRTEAAGAARKIMGEKLILTDAEPGKTYDGTIIATTNTYAIQQISGNQAVLHEIKDIAKESGLEIGKNLSITKGHEVFSNVREKSIEKERARESTLEG